MVVMTTLRCRNGHEKTPENTFTAKDGRPRCYVCKLASNERAAARMARNRNQQPPDGWEDEFGPVPPREARMVDWVEVLRAAERAADGLKGAPWYHVPEKTSQPRRNRLRSSVEGHVGSAYQPPGKRPTIRLLTRVR